MIARHGTNIISIWYFKINRYPFGSLIRHKSFLFSHGGMQQWGVNYWETYSPLLNFMSIRAILTLGIIIELHTKSVYFFLAYTQADVNRYIFVIPHRFWG